METFEEARDRILAELTSDDKDVRAEYLKHFKSDVEMFSESMARAFLNWRSLDSSIQENEKRAYISGLVYTAITLHVLSMKLFVSGNTVAAGNLFRQVVETVALALVCSGKDLGILDRFMEDKYSTNDAVRDAMRHAEKLGLNKDGVKGLSEVQGFYNKYSHPTHLTIAMGMSFSTRDLYFGGAFDEKKLDAYRKEISVRVGLANDFPNFIDGVKANVAKW